MNGPIKDDRLAHMVGVANYMYKNAKRYGLVPDMMYVLGLVHDIGYVSGQKDFHEAYGGYLLSTCFKSDVKDDIFQIISCHNMTPEDYSKKYNKYPPKELVLLWEADMSVDLTGEDVGFDERLDSIASRYGKDSSVYLDCLRTVHWLKINKPIVK